MRTESNMMITGENGFTSAGQGGSPLGLYPIPPHLNGIVAALFSGATDIAASHQLNYSPRTFSRRVGELLNHLQVQTRFQAGVKLGSPEYRALLQRFER